MGEVLLRYLSVISNDMIASESYLSAAGIGGLAGIALCILLKREKSLTSYGSWFLGCTYLTYVLIMTIFSRKAGDTRTIQLVPLASWGRTVTSHCIFIENILFFIPVGVFLPAMLEKIRKIYICVPVIIGISLVIEILQFITIRGYCQVDDLITNGIGALIGYGFFKLCEASMKKNE